MNEESVRIVQGGSEEEATKVLSGFNSKHGKSFSFPDVTKENKTKLVETVLKRLSEAGSVQFYKTCLETMRILSRERSGLDCMTTENALSIMVRHAGLEENLQEVTENITMQPAEYGVIVEAQKCLCNIVFNSTVAQRICSTNGCVEGIVQRLKTYKDPDLIHDVKFFDMRLLFLLTALVTDVRPRLRHDLHGFTYLIEVLDLSLRDSEESKAPLRDQDIDLACEILKILFNLTVTVTRDNLDEEEEAHFMRLVSVLHDLLICQEVASKDKLEELQSHTVNLLTNMPPVSYEELLTPLNEGAIGGVENKDIEYDGKNMEAVVRLLEFLDKRLDRTGDKSINKSQKESLTPILHCLCEICRANKDIRSFCRIKVLPHLRGEVKRLPEEGNSLRNKLCRLLTNPVTEVKDLAADFLFVLCKENVARFVKYTGYGNAAGLLAQRGLMCGGHSTRYSSESEESETEEYAELKSQINPVTGRWEKTKPDPMAGMSEEQKEYEAVQLVNTLDKLQRGGIIQPTTVGPDGKPVPVEHILQVLEQGQPTTSHDSDSD